MPVMDVGRPTAVHCVSDGRMPCEVVFQIHDRLGASDEEDGVSVVQRPHLIRSEQLFATKSSGEFPKGKRHKRNPSFISLAFLFCFDIIYGITFNLGQKKAGNLFRFPA